MSSQYLLMWLEAPLQSWGADSKFGRRDTMNFPTKSGVLGMLCCALGADGDQEELLAIMAPLTQTAISYVRARKNSEDEQVKLDREPLLRDFHMVGSGHDETDPWASLLIPKTSKGKKAVGGGTKITYRYYLQDAFFAVILQVPTLKAKTFADSLVDPVWDLYLGRKNCAPTDFISRGLFCKEDDAIEAAQKVAQDKSLAEDFRVLSGKHEGEVITINDVPVRFGENKQYRDRQVTVI